MKAGTEAQALRRHADAAQMRARQALLSWLQPRRRGHTSPLDLCARALALAVKQTRGTPSQGTTGSGFDGQGGSVARARGRARA